MRLLDFRKIMSHTILNDKLIQIEAESNERLEALTAGFNDLMNIPISALCQIESQIPHNITNTISHSM